MVAVCVSLVLIMFFVVLPLSYLFGDMDKLDEKNKDFPYSLGCGLYLAGIVWAAIVYMADKNDADDFFVVKWCLIALACISGILIIACVIKAMFKNFSE